jgi:hypothetical protein
LEEAEECCDVVWTGALVLAVLELRRPESILKRVEVGKSGDFGSRTSKSRKTTRLDLAADYTLL